MSKACTPDNAVGKFAAALLEDGKGADFGDLDFLDDAGKASFSNHTAALQTAKLTLNNPQAEMSFQKFINSTMVPVGEHGYTQVKGNIWQAATAPTDNLPPHITGPILDAVDRFGVEHGANFAGKQGVYKTALRKAYTQIRKNIGDLEIGQQGYLKRWLADLENGFPFYGKNGNPLTETISNFTGQQIQLSGNVLFGNIPEIFVKAPTIYGINGTLKGIRNLLELTGGNIWARIPELEARGLYGGIKPPQNNSLLRSGLTAWQQGVDTVMHLSNGPLVNLSYAIDGLQGVEKIAFMNRLGNASELRRDVGASQNLRFLNYTFGTYHLLLGMIGGLANPKTVVNSARGLATYFALTGILGGTSSAIEGKNPFEGAKASMIPEPLSAILSSRDPDFQEWEDENLSGIGRLIRPGGISGIGIAAQIINRNWSKGTTDLQKGLQSLSDGDLASAAGDFTRMSLNFAPFLVGLKGFGGPAIDDALDLAARGPLGNPRIKATIDIGIKAATGDIESDEAYEKLKEKWLPFLKEPQ